MVYILFICAHMCGMYVTVETLRMHYVTFIYYTYNVPVICSCSARLRIQKNEITLASNLCELEKIREALTLCFFFFFFFTVFFFSFCRFVCSAVLQVSNWINVRIAFFFSFLIAVGFLLIFFLFKRKCLVFALLSLFFFLFWTQKMHFMEILLKLRDDEIQMKWNFFVQQTCTAHVAMMLSCNSFLYKIKFLLFSSWRQLKLAEMCSNCVLEMVFLLKDTNRQTDECSTVFYATN